MITVFAAFVFCCAMSDTIDEIQEKRKDYPFFVVLNLIKVVFAICVIFHLYRDEIML
jgi:hypothetical protein